MFGSSSASSYDGSDAHYSPDEPKYVNMEGRCHKKKRRGSREGDEDDVRAGGSAASSTTSESEYRLWKRNESGWGESEPPASSDDTDDGSSDEEFTPTTSETDSDGGGLPRRDSWGEVRDDASEKKKRKPKKKGKRRHRREREAADSGDREREPFAVAMPRETINSSFFHTMRSGTTSNGSSPTRKSPLLSPTSDSWFRQESEPLLSRDSSSFVLVNNFIGARSINMWNVHYKYAPTGDITVHDVLLYVFTFLEEDMATLLDISRVSYAWRERANYLPQWATLSLRQTPFGRFADRFKGMGLIVKHKLAVNSREAYVQRRVADRIATREARREERHERRTIITQWVKWGIPSFLYHWGVAALVLYVSFLIGWNPDNHIEGDVRIGCASWFISFIMWFFLVGIFGIWWDDGHPKRMHMRTMRYAMLSFAAASTSVCLCPTVIVALLGTRLQALEQLNTMPTANVTCNGLMNSTTMPSQVHIQNTSLFEVLSANVSSAANDTISFILVGTNSSEICATAGITTTPMAEITKSLANTTYAAVVVALSVAKDFNITAFRWPPKNGSAYFRTATDTHHFSKNPNAAADRSWYHVDRDGDRDVNDDDANTTLLTPWASLGIPLVTSRNYDDLALVQRDYWRYAFWVLFLCGAVMFLPLVALLRNKAFSEGFAWFYWLFCVLVLNPIYMVTFGAICAFEPKDWCMMGQWSGVALFISGVLMIVIPLALTIITN